MSTNWTRRQVLATATALALLPRWAAAGTVALSGRAFGTDWRIQVRDSADIRDPVRLKYDIEAQLRAVDSEMSVFRPDSELMRFNGSLSLDWQPISAGFERVLAQALDVETASGGAFRPTLGPLVEAWGFGAGARTVVDPAPDAPAEMIARVRDTGIALKHGWVRKRTADTALDLGGIAKGDALDRVARVLDGAGASAYLIDIGGELRSRGSGWTVGLDNPGGGAPWARISLDDNSIATSGDYRSFFTSNNKRYSHLIDPATAKPIAHDLALVSVAASSAMVADAWATALMVLGPKHGPRLAEEHAIAALFLSREGARLVERATPAFKMLRGA